VELDQVDRCSFTSVVLSSCPPLRISPSDDPVFGVGVGKLRMSDFQLSWSVEKSMIIHMFHVLVVIKRINDDDIQRHI